MENNEYNFEDICRTCLSKDNNMKSVFAVHISDTHLVRVVDFIRRLTSIKIAKGDGLPENVCMCCIETLCKAYTFSQLCISSDNFLRLQRKRLALESIQNEIFEDDPVYLEVNTENDICEEQTVECSDNFENICENVEIEEIPNKNCSEGDHETLNNEDLQIKEKEQNSHLILENLDNVAKAEESTELTDSRENPLPIKKHKKARRNYQLKFQCDKCHESFSTRARLQKHESFHDSNNPYKCEECLKTFSKKTYLAIHMRKHVKAEDKQYDCTVCGQKFVYSYLLKQHSYKHIEEKPYPCSKCNKGCLTAESLRRHMRTHDENYTKKKHCCTVCSKEFPYPSFLAEHMKNHTGEKPFLCSICGRGFRQSGALEYHIRSHTGYKPFKCQICSNSFSSRGILRVHMRRHTDERPYICDICGMAFRQSTDMRSHRRIHTGDKHVLCTVCGKRMTTTGQLTVHLRSHTGEKPFGCDVCQKAFTTRTLLVKHYRIHTGERPYVCNICHRAFNQSGTLKAHMATHRKKHAESISENNKNLVIHEVIVYNKSEGNNKSKNFEVENNHAFVKDDKAVGLPVPIATS